MCVCVYEADAIFPDRVHHWACTALGHIIDGVSVTIRSASARLLELRVIRHAA